MTTLIWLEAAVQDLIELKPKNNITGKQLAQAITVSTNALKTNPHLGKAVLESPEFRDIIIPFGSKEHILRYRFDNGVIYVVQLLVKMD